MPSPAARSPYSQRGLSLVEILIALLLGLVLIGGATGVYLANQQTFKQVDQMARINENARLAFELLGRDLRQSGGMGCGRYLPAAYHAPAAAGSWWNQWGHGLRGYEQEAASAANQLPARAFGLGARDRVPGTDAVVTNLLLHAPTGGQIMPACNQRFNAWYVGNNGRGGRSLYRMTLLNHGGIVEPDGPEEMVENVSNLQIVYLVRVDGTPSAPALDDLYVTATRVNEWGAAQTPPVDGWSRVHAVRVALTFTTADAVGTDAQRIERQLPLVVGLRNRLP